MENKKVENKVLVLYILNKVKESLSENNLFSILKDITLDLNYFDFKEIINELLDKLCIESYEKDDDEDMQTLMEGFNYKLELFYNITKKGSEYLELTKDILPGILKLQVDCKFSEKLKELNDKQAIETNFTKQNNLYRVNLKIQDNFEALFNLNLLVGSSENAQKIIDNFKKNSNDIYIKILEILNT